MHAINSITQFTHFSEDDLNHLGETEIIAGFKLKNSQITRKYFYGFCQKAYLTWNKKYQLIGKEELDFYTISNDYYLRMVESNWKSLEVERISATLETWIIGGFRHTVLDALGRYNEQQEKKFKTVLIDNYSEKISNLADYNFKPIANDLKEIRDRVIKDDINKFIFEKHIIKGYKIKEIAEELKITSSAVSQRYKDIIKIVANYYKQDSYERV